MQDNLEETLQSRGQETSRTFGIRSKRGLKVKPRSCKLLQKGRKDHKYLQQLHGDSNTNVVWHLPPQSTKLSLSEVRLSWTVSGIPAPKEVSAGL